MENRFREAAANFGFNGGWRNDTHYHIVCWTEIDGDDINKEFQVEFGQPVEDKEEYVDLCLSIGLYLLIEKYHQRDSHVETNYRPTGPNQEPLLVKRLPAHPKGYPRYTIISQS